MDYKEFIKLTPWKIGEKIKTQRLDWTDTPIISKQLISKIENERDTIWYNYVSSLRGPDKLYDTSHFSFYYRTVKGLFQSFLRGKCISAFDHDYFETTIRSLKWKNTIEKLVSEIHRIKIHVNDHYLEHTKSGLSELKCLGGQVEEIATCLNNIVQLFRESDGMKEEYLIEKLTSNINDIHRIINSTLE